MTKAKKEIETKLNAELANHALYSKRRRRRLRVRSIWQQLQHDGRRHSEQHQQQQHMVRQPLLDAM